MRKVQFFELSRAMQERFLASAKGTAPPAATLVRRGGRKAWIAFAAGSGAAALALLIVLVAGFGALGSSLSVHSVAALPLYLGLLFMIPFGVLRALGLRREERTLPFKPGVYLFPMCLVDARTKHFTIVPMADMTKAEPGPGVFRVSFKGAGTWEFPIGGGDSPEQVKYRFDIAVEQAKHAQESGDDGELTTLDPFHEPKKWTSPIGPQQPMRQALPAWARLAWAIGAGVAVLFGPIAWFVRNAASDDATLAKAKTANTPDAMRAYLDHGRRHDDEVRNVLLPRAELEVAKGKGTVEAIQAFLASHPGSAIDGEARAALRDAYLAELEKAKAKRSLGALDEFVRAYPEHGLATELAAARHDLFASYLAAVLKASPKLSVEGRVFYQKLFAWLETHGPRVVVAFRREINSNLERADKLIGASPLNKGLGPTQVTRHFPEGKPQPLEKDVLDALARSLAKVVPTDALALEHVAAGELGEEALAQREKAPVLVVRYRIGWLGVAYGSASLKRAFAGIHVTGDAVALVPGARESLRTKFDIAPARTLPIDYASKAHPAFVAKAPVDGEEPEPAVYAAQELRALDIVTTSLEHMLLPNGK